MKKFFLFIYLACIATYFGYSQMSLSLSDSTGPIANNSTIIKDGTPDEPELVTYIFVTNTSANALPVLVKKVIIDTVPGSANMFCWGSCFAPTVYVSPNPLTIEAGRTDSLNFSGHYVPNMLSGESRIRYVFYSRDNALDSVCVNVAYSAFPVGVNNLATANGISNAYPNPADNRTTINYSLQSGNGVLVIRNLLGTVVREVELSDVTGKATIYTSDLPEGVYFYSLVVNGRPDVSKKLIIRH